MPSIFKKIFGRGKQKESPTTKLVDKSSKKKLSKKEQRKLDREDRLNEEKLRSLPHINPRTLQSPSTQQELNNFGITFEPFGSSPVKHNIVDLDDSSFDLTDTDGEEYIIRRNVGHDENKNLSNNQINYSNERFSIPKKYTSPSIGGQKSSYGQNRSEEYRSPVDIQYRGQVAPERLNNDQQTGFYGNNHFAQNSFSSPGSTDFCLSTDMDDDEYNRVKGENMTPMSDTSNEQSLFPGISNNKSPVYSQSHASGSNEDLSAWATSPPKDLSNDPQSFFPSNDFSYSTNDKKSPREIGSSNVAGGNSQSAAAALFDDLSNASTQASTIPSSLMSHTNSSQNIKSEEANAEEDFAFWPSDGLNQGTTSGVSGAISPISDPINEQKKVVSPDQDANPIDSTFSTASSNHSNTAASHAKDKLKRRSKIRKEREARLIDSGSQTRSTHGSCDESSDSEDGENSWIIETLQGTLGPQAPGADIASLSGRSARSGTSSIGGRSHRSHRSTKSHRSTTSRTSRKTGHSRSRRSRHHRSSAESVSSRTSHRSTRSAISQMSAMSDASRSVAKDLLRLEMQLAMVESENRKKKEGASGSSVGSYNSSNFAYAANSVVSGVTNGGASMGSSRKSSRSKTKTSRRNRITVIAPPGKLGIILANKSDSRGTVVSGVRSSSALADKIFPGDRIIMIDGEDVSRMKVSEITTIMARKNEFERTLTVMTTPSSAPTRNISNSDERSDTASFAGSHTSYPSSRR